MRPRSLRQLLAIRSALIAAFPFVLSAFLGWFWLRPQIVADTERQQRQLAMAIATRTEDYLIASSREIGTTASVLSRQMVEPSSLLKFFDTVLSSSQSLASLTFTDLAGHIQVIALPREKRMLLNEMLGIDLSLTNAVRQVRASGKAAWSDVYLSPLGGGLTVAYATPAASGVVLGEISLARLSTFLKGISEQEASSVFILDRRGQVIADQEGRFTARQYNLTDLEIVREGLASPRPVIRSFTFNGIRVVGCLVKAPLLGWSILVTSPVEVAYRSGLTTAGIFATALCLALLLASGLALFMSRSLATRFERLVAQARTIEAGGDAGTWPRTAISEFSLLGEALQSMADTVREREQRLNAQLNFLQQLLDSLPLPVCYKNREGVYLGCNAAFEAFVDMSRERIIGTTVYGVTSRERAERHHAADMVLLSRPGIESYESIARTGDGAFRNVIFNKATFLDAHGTVAGIVCTLTDITTLRKAEDELRESEEKFRVLAETSPTAIVVCRGDAIVYVNPSAIRLLGYAESELLNMKFRDWVHPDFRTNVEQRGLALQRGEPVPGQYELKFVKKNDDQGWVIVSAGRIVFGGKPGAIATLVDITGAKRAEEEMKAALAEKEVLLREVHHRVKNNMQIISSLLDLQSDSISDERTRSCLRESQNRVRSMALIHERLYQSKNFSSIDLGEYIRDLSNYLFDSYGVAIERVSLDIDAGNIALEINRAVPCGLIINELISNALKHAFPDGRSGQLSVRVGSDEETITLEVADTGRGMPAGLDIQTTGTLGLQLVLLLAKQLGGRASFSHEEQGMRVTVSFPADAPRDVARET